MSTSQKGAARPASGMAEERRDLLDRAWTDAAELYLRELVPRFAPWTHVALQHLLQHPLPPGPILVPCCGPGHELLLLHQHLGTQHAIVGIDLSKGMIEAANRLIAAHSYSSPPTDTSVASPSAIDQANETAAQDLIQASSSTHPQQPQPNTGSVPLASAPAGCQQKSCQPAEESSTSHQPAPSGTPDAPASTSGRRPPSSSSHYPPGYISAEVADACHLERYGSAGAVYSVFGLQQLGSLAPEALANWVHVLAPGGVCVVVLWPSRVEEAGPWEDFAQVVAEKTAADKGVTVQQPATQAEWEASLTDLAQAVPGAEVLLDVDEAHDMVWPDAHFFWKVMTEGGPWRARTLTFGEQHMEDLRQRFMARQANPDGPLSHRPRARLLVIRRAAAGQPLSAL